jgi:hypothetical protein
MKYRVSPTAATANTGHHTSNRLGNQETEPIATVPAAVPSLRNR